MIPSIQLHISVVLLGCASISELMFYVKRQKWNVSILYPATLEAGCLYLLFSNETIGGIPYNGCVELATHAILIFELAIVETQCLD